MYSPPDPISPRVSVLMPTFKHASFIPRALESLEAQSFADWELIVIDDGSPDRTRQVVEPYLSDPRITYRRLPANGGLGAALNLATTMARGNYLSYLPSDDVYYPDHLARLVGVLDRQPEVYLAYGGVYWVVRLVAQQPEEVRAPTIQGEEAVGREAEFLARLPEVNWLTPLPSGNILALVQVMHRRVWEGEVCWATRAEVVSDTLEADFWRGLLMRGAKLAYAGAVSCEWVNHADQRHKIIAGAPGRRPITTLFGGEFGLPRYRRYYGLGRGQFINWRPSGVRGMHIDENERYGRFVAPREARATDGLKILMVGELGWNPERIFAFEERGHRLYGLWIPHPQYWDAAPPFPFANVEDIPADRRWEERVRAIRPDVIYALLNWHALPLIDEVLQASLGVPIVFHFKESPFTAQELGVWPILVRALLESDGQIFINEESFEWFQLSTGGALNPATSFILDGDLPKVDWMTDEWTPKLSARDGAIHTVCAGRPLGLDPFEEIARAGIHVHFYGQHFHAWFPDWTKSAMATGFLHLHPTVEPNKWVRELSQYDAAWSHVASSSNDGDLRRAVWNDLNLPARLGTYAAAGLPWIVRNNPRSRVATERIAQHHGIGVAFTDFADLGRQLAERHWLVQLASNMRAVRKEFAFDSHTDDLIAFFRKTIQRHRRAQD